MALTEAQKQSRYKYAKEKLKRIPLDVQKSKYEEIQAHAKSHGETVNGFIKRAINETMERDNAATTPQDEPEGEVLECAEEDVAR